MPYEVVSVPTNNDSFFYAIAVQFRERRYKQPTPDSWFGLDIESDTSWRPPYHGHIHVIARQLRRRVADWAAREILDNTLEEISNAWIQVVAQRNRIPALLQELECSHVPILFTDALTLECVLGAFPEKLLEQWPSDEKKVDLRRTLLAFFLYWYSLTQDDIDRDPQFRTLASAFGVANPKSIPGTFDLAYNNYDIHCGFAPWAVTQLLEGEEIYLKPVVGSKSLLADSATELSDLVGFQEPDDYMFLYLHEDPKSWHALMWQTRMPLLGEMELSSEGVASTSSSAHVSTSGLARHERNTIRSPFLFSLCAWNVNHLPKETGTAVKEKKAARRHSARLVKRTPLVVAGPEGFLGSALVDPKVRAIQKVKAIQSLIDLNFDWLDVIALNEVNEGVDRLDELTACKIFPGPHLKAIGETGKVGQHEYYPLVVLNRDRPFTISHKGCTAVFASGAVRDVADKEDIEWSKHDSILEESEPLESESSMERPEKKSKKEVKKEKEEKPTRGDNIEAFRPIVVHRLLIDEGQTGQCWVNVGIIHTTPSGSEFERYHVFQQVRRFFELAGAGTIDMGGGAPNHWLVAGDYYLFGESRVIPDGASKKIEGKNVEEAFEQLIKDEDPTALENLDRLVEATKHDLERFIDDREKLPLRANQLMEDLGVWLRRHGLDVDDAGPIRVQRKELGNVAKLMEDLKPVSGVLKSFKKDSGKKKALGRFEAVWETQGAIDKMLRADVEAHSILLDSAKLLKALDEKYKQVRSKKEEGDEGEEEEQRIEIRAIEDEDDEKDEYVPPDKYFERNRNETFQRSKRLRNLLMSTFAAQISEKFNVMHTIWGTNLHGSGHINVADREKPEIEYTGFRIADFVVSSKSWRTGRIGLFSGEESGVMHVDDECVTTTRHWRILSDHFPVGGRFSLGFQDPRVDQVFVEDLDGEKRQARVIMYCLDACELIPKDFHDIHGELVKCWGSKDYGKAMVLMTGRIALWLRSMGAPKEIVEAIEKLKISDAPEHVASTLRAMTEALARGKVTSNVGGIWEMPPVESVTTLTTNSNVTLQDTRVTDWSTF